MTTSVIQQKGILQIPKDAFVEKKRGIPLGHRSGEKPLDPTSLF